VTVDQRVQFCPHCGEAILGLKAVSRGGMTRMQRVCLDTIARLTVDGVPPTFMEIARAIERNKSTVYRLVHGLRKRGFITMTNGARSISILPQVPHADAA